MSWPSAFDADRLDLLVLDRITAADAGRQTRTAAEILRRLGEQPGVVLADEVGMGKTFVALAVALSAMWADRGKRPVVIMVPTSVEKKWERDFHFFRERCIRRVEDRMFHWKRAKDALDFFRLLDDPPARRARLIFLAHGAFQRKLQDPWVKLAILKFALRYAHLGERKRDAIYRHAPVILRATGTFSDPTLVGRLVAADFDRWRDIIGKDIIDDDPIPGAIVRAIHHSEVDVSALRDALREMPERDSKNIEGRLRDIRQTLNGSFQHIWRTALISVRFRSPLLILDEAHHLKNPGTRLASLFVSDEAREDANLLSGALEGGFERMLFLTATPFQLGHSELLNVVDRFQGIDWKTLPGLDKASFLERRAALEGTLDEAQRAAVDFDWQWGKLRTTDVDDGSSPAAVDAWWTRVLATQATQPERILQVVRAFCRAEAAFRAAETLLQPWVVRHLRPRALTEGSPIPRRTRLCGDAIRSGEADARHGLGITDSALLPFLLAARAQAVVAHVARAEHDRRAYRATFAEGLSSSYEAFLETRADNADADESAEATALSDPRLDGYLKSLREALPDASAFAEHPKIAATTARVLDLWERGEKVIVFCHYRRTGRALVGHISSAIDRRLWDTATLRLGIPEPELRERAASWHAGFDPDRPLYKTLVDSISEVLDAAGTLPEADRGRIIDVARRFLRTPLYLLRFVDLRSADEDRPAALRDALTRDDDSGPSLRARVAAFARFFAERLTKDERESYLDALGRIHPGGQLETHDASEDHGGAVSLPNVRLASGAVRPETRERLLLGFNTPFFPEVLVASSVMAEGVDLHLNCRHMIHHDLDWNPSTLEQRTGRIDRIGAKCEQVNKTIEVCLPYIGGTQDEKMYRVVTDRERWFQIIMGEDYRTDEWATEVAAERVPLAEGIARALALRLEVTETRRPRPNR